MSSAAKFVPRPVVTQQEIDDADSVARYAQEKADEAEDEADRLHAKAKRLRDAMSEDKLRRTGASERSQKVRDWLERERVKLPGLTNAEVAIIERLIDDLEAT